MADVLIVGCGDLGQKVAQILSENQLHVLGVRRSASQLDGIKCIQADVTKADTLLPLHDVNPAILIYCVAADAQSDESYRLHYVEGFKHVLSTQKSNQYLQHIFFVSSTRVYGQNVSEVMNEKTTPMPNDFGGKRLLEAENLMATFRCGKTAVRLSGIYGNNRQYLIKMAKDPHRWPDQDRWTNRIHRDDAAHFLAFLCQRVLTDQTVDDCYIGTDGSPARLSEVLSWLATELAIEAPKFSEVTTVGGKRLDNQRMRAMGFKLQFPDYKAGYKTILKHV